MGIVKMKFGSHLYGLNTPESDIDYKGIFMPSARELLLGKYPKSISSSTGNQNSKNGPGDVDREDYALPYFVKLAVDGETVAIDMLHCNEPLISTPEWEFLVENRRKFYSKDMKAFIGYVKRQAAKYGIKGSRINDISKVLDFLQERDKNRFGDSYDVKLKDIWDELPSGKFISKVTKDDRRFYVVNSKMYQDTLTTGQLRPALAKVLKGYGDRAHLAAQNKGVDWKAMSHALRAGYQCRDIFTKGDFAYPLRETEFLLAVKQGRLDFSTEVAPALEEIVDEVEALAVASNLPKSVDVKFWDDWLVSVYLNNWPYTNL